MLKDNPNLEVLIVAAVFDKTVPMTKKKKRELAHNVYESALKQLDTLNSPKRGPYSAGAGHSVRKAV